LKEKRTDDGVLIDTCMWVEFFKKNPVSENVLEPLLLHNRVFVTGVVIFELIQGIKSEKERLRIAEVLRALNYIEMTELLWQKAGELASSLRKNGLNLPVSDILIATVALAHDLSVFTVDAHFESIPKLKIYQARSADNAT
jgi:predicted nucleic acid-binding protein